MELSESISGQLYIPDHQAIRQPDNMPWPPCARPERKTIHGRYILLEPLARAHFHDLWKLARAFPETWEFLPLGPFTREAVFITYLRLAASSPDEMIWCVRPLGRDGQPKPAAGWVAFLDIKPAHATIELGNIWFPPPLARSREATEAISLLLEMAFEQHGFLRVGWKCHICNQRSRAAAERLGFRFEGILRSHMIVKGQRRDSMYYAMLAEEWQARKPAFQAWLAPENFDENGTEMVKLRRDF